MKTGGIYATFVFIAAFLTLDCLAKADSGTISVRLGSKPSKNTKHR